MGNKGSEVQGIIRATVTAVPPKGFYYDLPEEQQ